MPKLIGRLIKRKAVQDSSILYRYWKFANRERVRALKREKSAESEVTDILVTELSREGILQSDVDRMLTADGVRHYNSVRADLLTRAKEVDDSDAILNANKVDGKKKPYLVDMISRDAVHQADSSLIRLALDTKLLEVVAGYMGLCPRLSAIYGWLNVPTNDKPQASQMWHRDPEDLRLIKVFIYLNDVDDETGPFTYVPKTHAKGVLAATSVSHVDRKRILDEEMNQIFPEALHRVCTGSAGSVILADTVGFHRGGRPKSRNRLVLTFTYTSSWPKESWLRLDHFPTWPMTMMQSLALGGK
jgi:hypothetical protein